MTWEPEQEHLLVIDAVEVDGKRGFSHRFSQVSVLDAIQACGGALGAHIAVAQNNAEKAAEPMSAATIFWLSSELLISVETGYNRTRQQLADEAAAEHTV